MKRLHWEIPRCFAEMKYQKWRYQCGVWNWTGNPCSREIPSSWERPQNVVVHGIGCTESLWQGCWDEEPDLTSNLVVRCQHHSRSRKRTPRDNFIQAWSLLHCLWREDRLHRSETTETPPPQHTDRQLDVPDTSRNKQQYPSHHAERLPPQCTEHRQTMLAGLLCLAARSRHTAAKFLPPSRSSGTFCTFFLQLFQSKSFSSFGRTPIVPVTLKIGLQCFKAAIGGVQLYSGDQSEGDNIIQRDDVRQKLLSSAFPASSVCRFQASALPWCDWAWGGIGKEGRDMRASSSCRGSWVALGIGDGQYEKGRKGLGGRRYKRKAFLALFFLEILSEEFLHTESCARRTGYRVQGLSFPTEVYKFISQWLLLTMTCLTLLLKCGPKIRARGLDIAYQRHHFFFQSLNQFVYGLWSPPLGKLPRLLHASISSPAKWEHVLDTGMWDLLMFDMMLLSTKSMFQSHTTKLKKITKISHNGSVGKSACLMMWVWSLESV